MKPIFLAIIGSLIVCAPAPRLKADRASAGVALGQYLGPRAILLAIDDDSLPLKQNLCYYLSKPTVRAEPVVAPSRGDPRATDSIGAQFYGTVLDEGGRFRMWYYGMSRMEDPKQGEAGATLFHEGPICHAISADGIHWTKPKLG